MTDRNLEWVAEVWYGTCDACPAHTVLRGDQPPPTKCAHCGADLASLQRATGSLWSEDK